MKKVISYKNMRKKNSFHKFEKNNSYSSRYINMYMTKEMKSNGSTPRYYTKNKNKSENHKETEDDFFNISNIKENKYLNQFNDYVPSEENDDLINIFNINNKKENSNISNLKLNNNKIQLNKKIRDYTPPEKMNYYEITDDDIYVNERENTKTNYNNNNIYNNDNKFCYNNKLTINKNKILDKNKKIIAYYSYENKSWILIKDNNKKFYWEEMNNNIYNSFKLNSKNNEIINLNNNDLYKKKYEKLFEEIEKYKKILKEKNNEFDNLILTQAQTDKMLKERNTLIKMLNDEKINLLKKVSENNNSNNNNKDITSLINSLQKENDILKNKNIILKQEIKKIPSLIEAEMKKFKENFKNNNNIKKIVIQQNNNNNKNKFVNLNLEKKIELNLISNNKNNNKLNNNFNNKNYENVEEDDLQNLQEMLIIKDKKNKVICKNLTIIEQYLNQIKFFENNQNNKVLKLIKQSLNL